MNRKILLAIAVLLILSACQEKKEATKPIPAPSQKLFSLMSHEQTGIDFVNRLRETPEVNVLTFKYFSNGGGVSIGDVNNDQLPDIYLTGNLGPNRLYINRGNLRFEDITRSAGVDGSQSWTTGTCMIDINNDGWLDIYVCRSGNLPEETRRNQLFVNNGDLTFTESAAEYGLADPGYSTQAAFLDYDLDGDLDMYLLNHNIRLPENLDPRELKRSVDPLVGDKFYKNEQGRYVDASREVGINSNSIGYGLGIGVGDLNQDGLPDIYVCNDFLEQDYLYINQGNGTFIDQIKSATGHTSNFAMGCDLADFNNDGLIDILVTDMAAEDNYRSKTNMSGMSPKAFWKAVDQGFHYQYMVNTLQLNRGLERFSEIGQMAGISYTDWSWAPLFADFDLDGLKDIFISNGYRKATRNNDFLKKKDEAYRVIESNPQADKNAIIAKLLSMLPEDKLANYAFKNNGDLGFSKKIAAWGLEAQSFSNGAAYGDLDLDGDLDLVINNIDQPVMLYRNNARQQNKGNYLKVKLLGPKANRQGLGAKVYVESGGKEQLAEYYTSRGYLSSVEDMLHFGIAKDENLLNIRVIWPDGKMETQRGVKANQILHLDYKNAGADHNPPASPPPLFTDITQSAGIDFVHKENEFDDFEKEILLPHKMSTLGPGLATGDVNGDQLQDFYIGGAKGQAGALYIQGKNHTFRKHNSALWKAEKASEDMDALFVDVENDGDMDLYVVSGGYDFALDDPNLQDRLYLNDGRGNFQKAPQALPDMLSSGSCVRALDYDQDGDTDLLVGGRVIPGQYPFPAQSYLLANEGGRYIDVTESTAPALRDAGLVTSALAVDLNGDGQVSLVLAGEWMPIRILELQEGVFVPIEAPGLQQSHGWWYSLAAADVDGDGDMDLLAGNLGLNYKYKASAQEPFHVYADDFDNSGSVDIYLGYSKEGKQLPVRGRECSSQQLPYIKDKFKTYDEFGQASIPDILGQGMAEALHLEAQTFASALILNQGNGSFEIQNLPPEAQFSSTHGLVFHDINGDGTQDILLAGNLYGSEVETPRNDAGMGLALLGDGTGGFSPLSLSSSGFLAEGNVKALASIDLGTEGWGVLVARNNDRLRLITLKEPGSPKNMALSSIK